MRTFTAYPVVPDEATTLRNAIRHCAERGENVSVRTENGVELWFVEADTKVNDHDPHFPVIVHRRCPIGCPPDAPWHCECRARGEA